MSIPKQVQERADAADKLLKEQVEGTEGKTDKDEDLKLVQAPEDDKGNQAGEEPIPDKDKPIDQDPPKEPAQEDFEQKYKVLKGKYDAEIKPLQDEVRGLRQRTSELAELLSKIPEQKAPPAKTPEKTEGPIEAKNLLSEGEIAKFKEAGYDESDLDVLALLAHRSAQKSVAPIESGMKEIAQNTAVTQKDRFWTDLDKSVEDREDLEGEDGFIEFIKAKAPYLNTTRQKVLEAAAKRLDLNTVVEIYDDYRKIRTKPSAPKANLEKQLEPGSGAGPEPPKPAGKIYKAAEIKQFYTDVTKGLYKHDPEEAERIDKDIIRAQVEGRIRP